MNSAWTHAALFVGSAIFAQRAGSSAFGFLIVTSSITVTCWSFCNLLTTSLLIAALPRTFTLFWRTTAGPGVMGNAGSMVADLDADLLGVAGLAFAFGA